MPNDFAHFEIEDFAFDDSFRQWVLDPASPHRPFWETYLTEHPQQTDKLLAARALVVQLQASEPPVQDAELAQTIWQNVQQRTQPTRQVRWRTYPVWRIAAALMLAVGLGVFGWYWQADKLSQLMTISTNNVPGNPTNNVPGSRIEEVNRTNAVLQIHLSDGSVVSLSKDSRLTYPRQFDARQRVVYLDGEAFFDVAKNPQRPFIVYARETVTKVLGTSFRIKAYADAPRVTVAVSTGRVSVFAASDFEKETVSAQLTGLVLTPNQQAVFATQTAQLSKTLIDEPVVLSPANKQPSFIFENTPVQTVFDILEKAYGVDIVYDADLIANRSLTVSLEDESLYDKLNVICKTVGLTYQIVDAQILITTKDAQ